ncbi:UNVERIFIED_CONTAM: hypothetical protein Scaly_2616200 [Sesamum calycinum]|uniref:Uncharacterized protein n=1 Tax=Sesamum calycinum TaxID=2727403 RepID=A0AAW2JCF0_9LAMI
MEPQRRLGIYVDFECPSIIKYIEPMTGDQFIARYLDCQFDEAINSLLGVANRLPDAFIDTKKVRKSHIPAENVLARLEVPEATLTQLKASESQIRRKRDKISEVVLSEDSKRNEQDLDDSYDMSINHAHNSLGWYRKEIEMNDIFFAYLVTVEIMDEDDNDPQTMEECQHRND